jgi:hypothetical protein
MAELDSRGDGPDTASPMLDLHEVAHAMQELSTPTNGQQGQPPLRRLVSVVTDRVPGARWASVTTLRRGAMVTAASTGSPAERSDSLQYELGSGPCVDVVLEDGERVVHDTLTDPRWPGWGQRVAAELGIRSVLAQRLNLEDRGDLAAGLNIYSDEVGVYDDHVAGMVTVLATHASLVVGETLAEERAERLLHAVESNREIGVAMGILMHQHRFTREQAFDVLRVASQNSNRKLADIAVEVVDTGTLSIARRRMA